MINLIQRIGAGASRRMQHASNQSVLQWSLKRLAMRPPAPPSTAPKLSRASRILVVRLDEIGDLVVTTPFMRALRNSARRAWITLIVREASAGLLMPSGLADEIISYPSGQSYRSARGRVATLSSSFRIGSATSRTTMRSCRAGTPTIPTRRSFARPAERLGEFGIPSRSTRPRR